MTVLRTLGQGGYARVYEVFNEDNELFALKVVDLSESKVKEELLKEIHFLHALKGCERVIQVTARLSLLVLRGSLRFVVKFSIG